MPHGTPGLHHPVSVRNAHPAYEVIQYVSASEIRSRRQLVLTVLGKMDYMYCWELPHVAAAIRLSEEFAATRRLVSAH